MSPRAMAARVAVLFGAGAVAAAGLVVAWWRHGSVQVTGVLLAVALACLAAGIGLWANRLTPQGPYQQRRPSHVYPEAVEEAGEDLAEGAQLPRRRLVIGTLCAVRAGCSGWPCSCRSARSGPVPGGRCCARPGGPASGWSTRTASRSRPTSCPWAGWPPCSRRATWEPPTPRSSWCGCSPVTWRCRGARGLGPEGLLAFSKVCTHAGCPVGLYDVDTRTLLCPCHQSAFDVLRGAVPISGPAAWPLPQLPLKVTGDGTVEADGPLSAPVGPGWWREGGR